MVMILMTGVEVVVIVTDLEEEFAAMGQHHCQLLLKVDRGQLYEVSGL